jgi:hypothetical protein
MAAACGAARTIGGDAMAKEILDKNAKWRREAKEAA